VLGTAINRRLNGIIGYPRSAKIMKTFTVKDLPATERPRERLLRLGSEALSSQELLTLLIGRGVAGRAVINIANELLSGFKSVKGISEAKVEQLSRIKGLGLAKAGQIKACFELGRRQMLAAETVDSVIRNPADIAGIIRAKIVDKAKENFKLVLLNTRNKIIAVSNISTGTLTASLVHPREVFKEAITRGVVSMILAHNHPSGDVEPSEADITLTKQLVCSGKLLDIEVIDHIIVSEKEYFSFKEKGLMK
jgi:DNA repair protein RadC